MRLPKLPWPPTLLQSTLLISVALHAVLLTIRFVDPERFNRVFEDTPLEVILVNARSNEKPVKAQAIAQADLAGGGNQDQGRATSPLPASDLNSLGIDTDEAEQQINQMQAQQQQLLADLRRQIALLPVPDPARPVQTPEEAQREERRRQMLRTLAEIEKRINEENARPRKRYISPATQGQVYAVYYDKLRRKIEERGTRDFPEYKGQKLYGELIMNITIDARGRIVDAEIVQASKSELLNRRALAIARAAAPFGDFTEAMRKQADQIVVTSRFRFTRNDGFEATAETSARP
ncbi:TonB family protein [Ideonella dechloratans]|uniref:TonB family protein n=1 Tax=Ideonella dechloratans TaxID=36863 RepID=A0A643FHC4_IDEDE|nr:TonB family protein [Ideonella dechloratans]KAB0585432.1 TonB family protein [Ideonella dechloratans]UFU09381.1 TonB C-terminal domain-containing protein [Ideonella dechloratans]